MLVKFKNSQDYIDICYMIDHVRDVDVRLSVLEQLGYKVGTIITRNDSNIKDYYIDKQDNIRMQVTNKFNKVNIASCVIINPKKLFFQK